jgi:hypothetical protein
LNLVIAAASGHASTESAQGQKRHELRENKLGSLRSFACERKRP